jgi:hypothetical protein
MGFLLLSRAAMTTGGRVFVLLIVVIFGFWTLKRLQD